MFNDAARVPVVGATGHCVEVSRRGGTRLACRVVLIAAGIALVCAVARLLDDLDSETAPPPFFSTPG